MNWTFLFALILPAAVLAQSQTIGQLLQSPPSGKPYTLALTAQAVKNNPEWDTPGEKTLFVSVDAGAPPSTGRAGSLFLPDRALDFRRARTYDVLSDAAGQAAAVYDNYDGSRSTPDYVRMRFGTDEARVLDMLTASNGVVYVMNKPIPDLELPLQILQRRGFVKFVELAMKAGIDQDINALRAATLLIPSNAALTAMEPQLNELTTEQLAALLAHHIVPRVVYSHQLQAQPISSYTNQTISVNIQNNGEWRIRFGGAIVTLADTVTSVGVIHLIDNVIIPNELSEDTLEFDTVETAAPSESAPPATQTTEVVRPTASSRPISALGTSDGRGLPISFALMALSLIALWWN